VIALVRVDNRLVHGQILEAWLPRLKAARIVIADDDAAASPLARAAMTLCLPPELPADVVRVEDVDWEDLAARRDAVLVLVREVKDLSRAAASGLTPAHARRVNIGNVHFGAGRRPVSPSVFLSAEEVEALRALEEQGFEVEARAIPADPPLPPAELAARHRAAAR
jgi:PTS system mannose-specific IIB component